MNLCAGEEKNTAFYTDLFKEVINEVGPSTTNLIVTDNASVMIAAGRNIEKEFKHVAHQPCVAHILDLLMEDVAKLPGVSAVREECTEAVKFLSNHQMPLALFNSVSKLKLVKCNDTR